MSKPYSVRPSSTATRETRTEQGARLSVLFRLVLLAGLVLAGAFAQGFVPGDAQAAPLLQEGKKTLYQRVISHPGAVLRAEGNPQSQVVNRAVRPFTPLYVYERGNGWLNVGAGTGKADGWIEEKLTTPWNQALTLLFTNRSRREPVLFFKDLRSLREVCDADDMVQRVAALNKAAAEKKANPLIIAAEPTDTSVDTSRFYIMPILEVQEPYEGTKLLNVASIDPGTAGAGGAGSGTSGRRLGPDGKPLPQRTAVAIVMDTTISMQPYIDHARAMIKGFFDEMEKNNVTDSVAFAFVAFRNSTAAVPELGYIATTVSDFVTAKNRKELESRLAQVNEAKVSTHSYNEDSMAGVYEAIENLSWEDYDSRLLLLVTDAGPLPPDDRYRTVQLDPREMADKAAQKGIWVVTSHILTPQGKSNQKYAADCYRALSTRDGSVQYQPVDATSKANAAKAFDRVGSALGRSMLQMVVLTRDGRMMTKPANEKTGTGQETPEDMASRLGYAMQLEYLGRARRTAAPEVVSSWIADMDLTRLANGQHSPTVEVAVLLTKAQLSDLHSQIGAIIDNAERTKKTDSRDFFQGILSASARTARDPNMPTAGKTLAELGVLAEFLDGLPYTSDVMRLTEEDWYRRSVGEQTAFLNRLKSKMARYEEYDRDRDNWEKLGTYNANDWVYRVPLSMLP